MNKIIVSATIFFMLFSLNVSAHENIGSVEEVLSEIQASQGVSLANQIDCSKIQEHQFEELGDALMEQMHPGEAHETMDAMMGGEGSESLKATHVSMGKNYLRCGDGGMMGSGSGGMMSNSMMQGMMNSGMMQSLIGSNFQMPYYFDYTIFLIIIVLLFISIALNVYLIFKIKGGKK